MCIIRVCCFLSPFPACCLCKSIWKVIDEFCWLCCPMPSTCSNIHVCIHVPAATFCRRMSGLAASTLQMLSLSLESCRIPVCGGAIELCPSILRNSMDLGIFPARLLIRRTRETSVWSASKIPLRGTPAAPHRVQHLILTKATFQRGQRFELP
jgi:hypothetical protein